MTKTKTTQIPLTDYLALKEKKGKRKKLIEFPPAVIVLFAIPFIFFIILLLSYILYIRRFSPVHG